MTTLLSRPRPEWCVVGALILASITLTLPTPTAAQEALDADISIPEGIERLIDARPVDQAHWGVLVVDLETGDTLYARNAHRKFIPASNMKVLVTAAALWELGADYRFRTEVHAVGDREGDVLRGDLVVLPSGDPTWSERWHEDDPEAPLRSLARQVAASGLTTISGDVIVAASRWDSTAVAGSWMSFNVPWGFSAGPAPFALAEGTTTIEVAAGASEGDAATVSWTPRAIPGFVDGFVTTVARTDTTEVDVSWLPESGIHRISGTVRAGTVDSIDVATRVATLEARTRFVEMLAEEGVDLLRLPAPADTLRPEALRPRTGIIWTQADSLSLECDPVVVAWCDLEDPVAWWESPPLMEIAKNALEPSQNWITEQLLRSLALNRKGVSSFSNGTDALVEILGERAAVDTLDLALQDGSGLSAYNLITPRAVVSILTEMDRSPMAAEYRDALAAPGEEDSTLEYRLGGFESRIQAKTGTISNVNSLSGYVFTDSGRRLVFSILTNGSGMSSSRMRRAIDGVAAFLAGS